MLGLLHLVPSLWSSPLLSSGPQGRFLALTMPLEIPRGPYPPEGQGASNPLVREGLAPEPS